MASTNYFKFGKCFNYFAVLSNKLPKHFNTRPSFQPSPTHSTGADYFAGFLKRQIRMLFVGWLMSLEGNMCLCCFQEVLKLGLDYLTSGLMVFQSLFCNPKPILTELYGFPLPVRMLIRITLIFFGKIPSVI